MTNPIVPSNGNHSPPTSISLLRLALDEDREAWERIVYLYSPLVERWCRRRNLSEEEVQDVGQDVFMTLYKNLHQFSKERPEDSFRKWLRAMTENKISDYFKKTLRNPLHYIDSLSDEPAPPVRPELEPSTEVDEELSEPLLVLRRCLEIVRSEFEPNTFEAFRLAAEGLTTVDVASTLSMSTGAVYTARSRVMKRLRELLAELEENLPDPGRE